MDDYLVHVAFGTRRGVRGRLLSRRIRSRRCRFGRCCFGRCSFRSRRFRFRRFHSHCFCCRLFSRFFFSLRLFSFPCVRLHHLRDCSLLFPFPALRDFRDCALLHSRNLRNYRVLLFLLFFLNLVKRFLYFSLNFSNCNRLRALLHVRDVVYELLLFGLHLLNRNLTLAQLVRRLLRLTRPRLILRFPLFSLSLSYRPCLLLLDLFRKRLLRHTCLRLLLRRQLGSRLLLVRDALDRNLARFENRVDSSLLLR